MKDPVAPISTPLTRKSTSKEASFERDIKPLFLPQDVQCMRARNVFLGDYEFMKVPQNARMVLARLSGEQTPRMPEGGPYWGRRQLRLFRTWIRQGLKP